MRRRPQGEAALTGAERQARYRLRLGLAPDYAPGQLVPHRLPRARPLSRRWHDTVAGLVSLQSDYARWLDALPQATRDTATGEALQAMVDLDLEDIIAIQPPRGFGRD
ncbi:MAG TPA: hypothetical protein VJY15_15835 [Candidatus Acidoferrum sp.]|nr:hypothetical protein [Candidatus Acidoferrum sp.]